MQQVFSGVCAQDHIRVLAAVCACLPATLQRQTNGVGQIVFALRIGLGQTAQQFQQCLGFEPVCAGIYLVDLTLCLGGILFLYDSRNAGLRAEDSAVALGLFQIRCDDCDSVLLCLMQFQRIGNGLAVHKRCIATQHQGVAVGEFLHELFCLHHCMTRAQLLCLECSAVTVAQIQLHILRLIASDHTDPAQSCALTGTDDPAQHGNVQHLEHRLRDCCLHTIAVSAGKNNNLIHSSVPPVM